MSDTTMPYDGSAWHMTQTALGRPLWYWTTPTLLVAAYRDEGGRLIMLRVPRDAQPGGTRSTTAPTRSIRFAPAAPVPRAKLDTQGLMFTKISIGDQVLHIPWLPKPGGTP